MTHPLRPLRPVLAALAVALLAATTSHAEMIIFKDGTVLQGKVVRERKTIVDPGTGDAYEVNEGFFMVYDGARTIVFSTAQLDQAIDDQEFAPEKGELRSGVPSVRFPESRRLPPIVEVTDFGQFDKDWNRTFTYTTLNDRPFSVKQNLTQLTPYFTRLDSAVNIKSNIQYLGTTCYLTKELGPAMVRGLLADHKDTRDLPDEPAEKRVQRRLKSVQFLAQSGWLDHAAGDLDKLGNIFPDQKDLIDTARGNLQKMRNLHTAKALKVAYRAGNFKHFDKLLQGFAEDGVPEPILNDLRQMKDGHRTSQENVKLADRFLTELPKDVPQQLRDLFTEAAEAVRAELTPDNVDRLEKFLGQAKQAERQKAGGANPTLAPVNLLALALTGWTLGNLSAQTDPAAAQKLWQTRQMVLKHQATHNNGDRRDLLDRYLNDKSGIVPLDELAQIVTLLPPPEPEPKFEGKTKDFALGRNGRGPTYTVQLPREYSHGRPWPVLIVACGGGQEPKDMLDKWSEGADAHGYILAAPKWVKNLDGSYGYTSQEQDAVLEALRDLKRRFNVDCDRVFLFGFGSGGNLAFDVGLSHPDLFAGVLPMSSLPGGYCWRYRNNAQHLPFYVVTGDRLPDNKMRKYLDEWIPYGYPLLYAQYLGRGLEWFAGELDLAFDWMDRKERYNPVAQLGRREFTTVRSTDNRFYWLTTDGLMNNQLNENGQYNGNVVGAQLMGSLAKNQVSLRVGGLKQVSIWLGRDDKGQHMVDFDKEVAVYINGTIRMNRKVTPSVKVLLEDLYDRGDRQRLYFARIDFDRP